MNSTSVEHCTRHEQEEITVLAMLFLLPFLFLVVFGHAFSFDNQDVPTVTTHHLDEAGECDRLVLMAAGRVVAQGALADTVGDGAAVAVRAALDTGGIAAALSVVPATFEETFVRLALARQDLTPTARERTSQ